MSRELLRLLKSHEFLKGALEQHGSRLSVADAAQLSDSLDGVFEEIVRHASDDPRVTIAQTRFLMASLAELATDSEKSRPIWTACQSHLERLTWQLATAQSETQPLPPNEYGYLDCLTDRIGILDRDFRYIFTNKANAAFHADDQASFVGRANWQVTGERFFQLHNKPRFELCLAGKSTSCISAHPGRDPAKLYWVRYEPVRNAAGNVHAIFVISSDVSDLPIPPEFVTPQP